MKLILLTAILFAFITFTNAQDERVNIDIDRIHRKYEVYAPQSIQPKMPLVIGLHGWSNTVELFVDFTIMDEFADTAGFIFAVPHGIDASWNIGVGNCPVRSPFPESDDVKFINAVIDDISQNYDIDMERIYCCGFSTGGEMSYRLACELGEKFAAIGVVSGGLFDAAENWHPVKPMPVIHFHGTEDTYFLYDGPGSKPVDRTTEEWSIKKTLDYWIETNHCRPKGDTITLPDLDSEDNCIVQKITFSDTTGNENIVHFKIIGGGHNWPGTPFYIDHPSIGNKTMDINTNVEMWNFFKSFTNPLTSIASNREGSMLTIYPNPARDILHLKFEKNFNSIIKIYNINGNLIFHKSGNSQHEKIDVSDYSKGIYIVKIIHDKVISTHKILIY